jgi:hypothetical protein
MILHEVMVPNESNSARSLSSSHPSAQGVGRSCQHRCVLSSSVHITRLTINVLDVKVDTLALALLLDPASLVAPPELFVTLGPLLSTSDKQLLSVELGVVELLDGLLGVLVLLVVYETETLGGAGLVLGESARNVGTVLAEELLKLLLSDLWKTPSGESSQ